MLPSLLLGLRPRRLSRSASPPQERRAYDRKRFIDMLDSIANPFFSTLNVSVNLPYDGLTHYKYARVDPTNNLIAYKNLPACKFDSAPPAFPAWTGVQAGWHEKFLNSLHRANVTTVLTFGSLLGAYRHHGTIPFDEDADMVFSVCENIGLVRQSHSRFKTMSCEEIGKARAQSTETQFDNELWNDVLKPVLTAQNITMVNHTEGGIRLSNGGNAWNGLPGGIGVDFLIIVKPLAGRVKSRDLCKCTFGQTFAYCNTDSERILLQEYGADFMVPKSQCDFYKDIGHADWAWRSKAECSWAKDVIAKKAARSGI
eukprot:TRINITY_DN933_c0_g1_i1.p1 TRINITY_DN933_c0_g1~~TRINITY_DN933_c0_g1_i1.p1  ORF type:complete len:350 (-),score=22.16 TRINITY_DN933_c0_g1_i1:116-1054(-)